MGAANKRRARWHLSSRTLLICLPAAVLAGTSIVHFGGDVRLSGSSSLEMEIGGSAPGSGHDQLQIAGDLFLEGGHLDVVLIGGFTPSLGDRFDLFDASATHGTFDSIALPPNPPSGFWNRSELYSDGQLSIGTIPDNYPAWANLYGAGPPAADDDCDGLPNLIEYLLARHPKSATGADGVTSAPSVSRPGGLIAITFSRPDPVGADGVYIVEVSDGLDSPTPWTTVATKKGADPWIASGAVVTETTIGGLRRTVVVQTTATGGKRQFIRLRGELLSL